MNPLTLRPAHNLRRLFAFVAVSAAACLAGCSADSPTYCNQRVFAQPEQAVASLQAAVNAGNPSEFEAIFGSEARDIMSSGDPVDDRRNREIVSVAMNEQWRLAAQDSTTRELVIGNEAWPFPIPLVKDSRGWWFDTGAGKEEIRARRIGRNELATIGTLRTYVRAQREYASIGRDDKPAGIFAQQIRSDSGRHNGLCWPASGPKDKPSPLGEFIVGAAAEGYNTQAKEGELPYHGYFFRILKRQGASTPGGAMEYIVNGEMSGGFAMIAFPANYGSSGVMTFIVGPEGTVFESDLGESTPGLAAQVTVYDPDASWKPVK